MRSLPVKLRRRHRRLYALEAAARTGEREAIYPLLAPDVEWVTPKRTLHGLEEVREQLTWGVPPEHVDLEFEVGKWKDLGDGRLGVDVDQTYRVKGSGDFAYKRDRRIELTIQNGKISRYEMRIVG